MILSLCLSMIFSENRFPLFRIMLSVETHHALIAKALIGTTEGTANSVSPSPGGGGSIAREAGERGGVISPRNRRKRRDHPTPAHVTLCSV